jgi:bacterioferritin-associated ferredoxin
MVVCHCLAVNDGTIARALAEGADTVEELTARCGAGGRCGGCRPLLAELVAETPVGNPRAACAAA